MAHHPPGMLERIAITNALTRPRMSQAVKPKRPKACAPADFHPRVVNRVAVDVAAQSGTGPHVRRAPGLPFED
jgi:hypothetical protein